MKRKFLAILSIIEPKCGKHGTDGEIVFCGLKELVLVPVQLIRNIFEFDLGLA
jgi:hypothetical protein